MDKVRLRKMGEALTPYDIQGGMVKIAIPCPCGLQYTRDLPGGGRAIFIPPEGWRDRIIQRKAVESNG